MSRPVCFTIRIVYTFKCLPFPYFVPVWYARVRAIRRQRKAAAVFCKSLFICFFFYYPRTVATISIKTVVISIGYSGVGTPRRDRKRLRRGYCRRKRRRGNARARGSVFKTTDAVAHCRETRTDRKTDKTVVRF